MIRRAGRWWKASVVMANGGRVQSTDGGRGELVSGRGVRIHCHRRDYCRVAIRFLAEGYWREVVEYVDGIAKLQVHIGPVCLLIDRPLAILNEKHWNHVTVFHQYAFLAHCYGPRILPPPTEMADPCLPPPLCYSRRYSDSDFLCRGDCVGGRSFAALYRIFQSVLRKLVAICSCESYR